MHLTSHEHTGSSLLVHQGVNYYWHIINFFNSVPIIVLVVVFIIGIMFIIMAVTVTTKH